MMKKILNFFEKKKFKPVLYIFLIVVFAISYFRVPFLFFQQDELFGFGEFIKMGNKVILRGLGSSSVTHFVPVTMSLSFYIFSIFGFKYWIYNTIGLSFHLINCVLLFYIAKQLFKNNISVYLSTVFFLSSSVAAELIMWPVININTLSLTFSLIAWLIILINAKLTKFNNYQKGILVSLLFLLSIFSVEYSAGFVLFIPLLVFFSLKDSNREKVKYILPFVVTTIFYLLIRFLPFIGKSSNVGFSRENEFFVFRILQLIPRYFAQLTFGQDIVLKISEIIAKVFYSIPSANPFTESRIFPRVSELLGLVVIVFLISRFTIARKINSDYSKKLFLSILLVAFSSLPFLLVPGEANNFSIFSSRYLYFGLSGISILLAYVVDLSILQNRNNFFIFTFILSLFFITYGVVQNNKKSLYLYNVGNERLKIINSIVEDYPKLPQKTVFYIESNKSYYGLKSETKIMPFQSGFGQTLLVFYSKANKLPLEFYPGSNLWEIKSQDYKEIGSYGFGYFREKDLLKASITKYNLPQESIIAYSWNGDMYELTDITENVKREIFK